MEKTARARFIGLGVFLYGALLAGAFVALIYRRQGLIAPVVDLNGFGRISENLAAGKGFSLFGTPTVRRGPLYPFFGALLLELFGASGRPPDVTFFRPLIIANCVIFGLTCVAVWHLAGRLFGPRVALVAALVCPLVPQSMRYVGMTEVETLMGLWTVLLASTGLTVVLRPNARSGLFFGLTVAAATLTKPIVMLYPFVLLPLAYLRWRKTRTPVKEWGIAGAVALTTFAVLLVPWSVRNMEVTHGDFKGISSNGPGEFLRGYVNAQPKYYLLRQNFGGSEPNTEKWDPEANQYEDGLLRAHGLPFFRCGGMDGKYFCDPPIPDGVSVASLEVQKDKIESAEMKRRVLHDPLEFVGKFAVQLLTFWYIVETRSKSVAVGTIAAVTLILAALGARSASRAGVVVWPAVTVLAYMNAIYAAFLAFARYSMPLFPTLVVFAAGGLAWLYERFVLRATPPP